MTARRVLRWLGRHAYGTWIPAGEPQHLRGAERFLEDVWRDAPRRVAAAHTAMAIATCALPLLVLRTLRPLPWLGRRARDTFARRVLGSASYPLRLLGYAMRGNALVAVLRDPDARAALLGTPPPAHAHAHPPPSPGVTAPVTPARPAIAARADAADVVVVGSGAAGATVAAVLGERGADTIVLEEGGWRRTADFTEDLYGAMASLFRDFGAQVARGRIVVPVLEGCCVGGTTVVNGAIVHRLPKEIHEDWCRDAGIAAALPFAELEDHAARIEEDLGIEANLASLLSALPISATLRQLGWAHGAMRRNAPGCRATGRCLQGCPSGGKLSMEASYIPRAMRAGVRVFDRHRALRIVHEGGRATGVEVADAHGGRRIVHARTAVIVAAGTIQSPLLLRRSGLGGAHAGRHFQCHLGVGALGLLPRPVREIEGPPQGLEVFEFETSGIKLATQLLPPELLLARTGVTGSAMADLLRAWTRLSAWTVSVRSRAEGVVSAGLGGPSIRFSPAPEDVAALREGVWRAGQLFAALGAGRVFPNIAGLPAELRAPDEINCVMTALLDARSFSMAVGHVFGTCRMGSDPAASVVAPDFRVHGTEGLYVVDASVFPTNTGVNPQLAVMTLARHAALGVAGRRA